MTQGLAQRRADRPASYAEVLRARGELVPSGETVEMAVPPGSAAFVRGGLEMIGLLGARCIDCATISTPPSLHPACTGCGGAKLEEVALARTGTVHTFVVNHTMPEPFVAPLPLVVVDLDDGARIMLQGTTDDAAGDKAGTGADPVAGLDADLVFVARTRPAPVQGSILHQRGQAQVRARCAAHRDENYENARGEAEYSDASRRSSFLDRNGTDAAWFIRSWGFR